MLQGEERAAVSGGLNWIRETFAERPEEVPDLTKLEQLSPSDQKEQPFSAEAFSVDGPRKNYFQWALTDLPVYAKAEAGERVHRQASSAAEGGFPVPWNTSLHDSSALAVRWEQQLLRVLL